MLRFAALACGRTRADVRPWSHCERVSPCPQHVCQTEEGWLAPAQVVRYHQPPESRIHQITLESHGQLLPSDSAELDRNLAVLRVVFPTLTLPGAYPNIYRAEYRMEGDLGVPFLSLFKQSHITRLVVDNSQNEPALVATLVDLLRTGRLRSLCIDVLCAEQLVPVIEAIRDLPPEFSLSSLSVSVESPTDARAVLSLADSTAMHTLRNIRIACYQCGFVDSEAGTDVSMFRLLTIPAIRTFALSCQYRPFLTPSHVNILRDCVRARALSGTPTLRTLFFDIPLEETWGKRLRRVLWRVSSRASGRSWTDCLPMHKQDRVA